MTATPRDSDDVQEAQRPRVAEKIAADVDDAQFEQRVAALCRQVEARQSALGRESGRAAAAAVFPAERPFSGQVLTMIALAAIVTAAGAGGYMMLDGSATVIAPGAPAVIKSATAAPAPPKPEADSAPSLSPSPIPAVSSLPAPLPLTPRPPAVATEARVPSPPPPVMLAVKEPPPALVPLDSWEIIELQDRLNALGFSAGALDGIAGPLTSAAIRRYQEFAGRVATGEADRDILQHLRRVERSAGAEPAETPAPR